VKAKFKKRRKMNMDTIKIKFHHEESGKCTTIFKDVDSNKYYSRLDKGGWYTVYPSKGYWESCDRVSNDIVFEILDFNGNTLFTESNANLGAFISLSDKAKQVANVCKEGLELTADDDWRKWLKADMEAFNYTSYVDNWLFYEVSTLLRAERECPLMGYSHLGVDFVVLAVNYEHKICKKRWYQIAIYEKKDYKCVAICGYMLK